MITPIDSIKSKYVLKRNRRGLKKNKGNFNVIGQSIIIVGINAAGITSKMDSFDKLLFDLQPSIWMLQETKRKQISPKMKAKNSKLQVFEMCRIKTKEEEGKNLNGGGLAIGALHDLKPMLVRQGDDDVECMTIQVSTGHTTFRCVVGYGPQIDDSQNRKQGFWNYLDQEVESASSQNIGIVIQIDSNSWAGNKIIPNDPNPQNINGKLLKMFLDRNKNITLINSQPLCDGLITRQRKSKNSNEKSVLDLFMVCDNMFPHVSKMYVDEQGLHRLTNFFHKQGRPTETDHSTLVLHIDLKFKPIKPHRVEEYNFRSTEGQNRFQVLTTDTNMFSECFKSNKNFSTQVTNFEERFKMIQAKSFCKIRTRKRKFAETEVGKMLEARKKLKLELNSHPSKETEAKLKDIETKIAQETEYKFAKAVKDNLAQFTGDDGAINTNGLWSAKNRIMPKDKSCIPIALNDKEGNIISSPEGIKELCLNEMLHRLRHRKIHPKMIHLKFLKELLWKKRLRRARNRKTHGWKACDLKKVLNGMKNNRCRDPQGLVNEIFKTTVAGVDMQKALLLLVNKTKETHEIPNMMKISNISMIPKPGKLNSRDIKNQRGIFLISIFRTIILKLILKDETKKLDAFMSDGSVGGRKSRRIQDHLFIVNGVVFEHARSKSS